MKTWKIPLHWELTQILEVSADSLDEALSLAKLFTPPQLSCDDGCFGRLPEITSDEEYIRWIYNDGQDDDI